MMRRRSVRRLVAALVLLGSWLPALASIAIAWVFALPENPVPGAFLSASPAAVQSRFDDIGVTVALIYGALSAALIARRPHPVVVILAVHAIGSGIAAFGVQWGLLGERLPGLPLHGLLLHAAGWGYVLGTVGTTIVPLLVLRPPPPRGRRVIVALGVALAVVVFLATLTHQAPGAAANPLAVPIPGYQAALPSVYGAGVTIAVGLSVVVAVLLAARWAGHPPEGRRRLGWLVAGHLFLTVSYAALILPADAGAPAWVWDFGAIAPVVGQMFYPSAVLVLVLGARLRGVDLAVNRVLVWSIVTVAAAGSYLVLGDVIAELSDWPDAVIGVTAAAVVAVALIPARDWVQARVDALVWTDGADPDELVRRLGQRIGDLESGGQGLAELAAALRSAFRLGSVEIRSADPEGERAAAGVAVEPASEFELRVAGEVVGALRAAPRRGDVLHRRVRRDLTELAPIIAVALRLVQASGQLEAARDAVLAARHGERRQLRRELHDGIGPALAGIGFGLAAVERLIDDDPAAARELSARLVGDLRERLGDVRRLLRAVRAEHAAIDLATDLTDLARDFSTAGAAISVDVAGAAAVPSAARRALSLIAAEAVHNAVRHAGAAGIRISLTELQGAVELEIADDGRGIDGGVSAGIGMATMRERASEIGAEFAVESRRGAGTAVRVRVPIAARARRRMEEVPA